MELYTDLKCCLCSKPITPQENGWKEGHNAEPIGTGHGRCCEDCNDSLVIPIRWLMAKEA